MIDQPRKYIIVIGGPTGSGKTSLAIRVARLFDAEIISADSRQVYKEMNVGVARPDKGELKAIKHHFIASHSIHEPLNAGSYAAEARKSIDALFERHNVIVVAGGTGLYLKALLEGFDPLPSADHELRSELDELFRSNGIKALQEKYYTLYPGDKQRIETDNPQRLIRAIEIGMRSGSKDEKVSIPGFRTDFELIKWCISIDREELYQRINDRVDQMLENGLEDEARMLFKFKELNALRTVGYTELFDYFEGKTTRDVAVEKIKQHTRNYAKRQLTWFRKDKEFQWIASDLSSEEIKTHFPAQLLSYVQK